MPGGILVTCGDKQIGPSCCCGLEGWREWVDCLETGHSPWLGHDPFPKVVWEGELARIWSDSAHGRQQEAFVIEIAKADLRRGLVQAHRDLQGFLSLLQPWAERQGFSDAAALRNRFDACFAVSAPI